MSSDTYAYAYARVTVNSREGDTMIAKHYHVESGMQGYGPDSDDGWYAHEGIRDVADAIRDELSIFEDIAHDSAESFADAGDFESAWSEHKRVESFEFLRANLSNDRESAPLYVDNPALWEGTLARIIGETFPLDVSHNARLYVWECAETDCHNFEEN